MIRFMKAKSKRRLEWRPFEKDGRDLVDYVTSLDRDVRKAFQRSITIRVLAEVQPLHPLHKYRSLNRDLMIGSRIVSRLD